MSDKQGQSNLNSANKKKNIRLLMIANVPGPNLNDFYDQVSKEDSVDLTVLYCSKRTRKWKEGVAASDGYKHIFLWNFNPFSKYARWQINPGVVRYLLFSRSDAVQIQGYTTPTLFFSLLIVKLFKKPFVFWGEMIDRSQTGNSISLAIKKFVVRTLNSARRVYIVGSFGIGSYTKRGLDKDLVRKLPYSCDLSPFFAISQARDKDGNRKKYNIITTSQLIHRKRVDLLIKSFISLADEYPEWNLKIIGDGPLRSDLEELVPQELKSRIDWLGYMPKTQHPEIYQEGDIFVLASREDGGPMALAEAMASGLPAITTDGVATANDMIEEGVSGYIVPKDDQGNLEQKMRVLFSNEEARIRMGREAAESAKQSDARHLAKYYADDIKSLFLSET